MAIKGLAIACFMFLAFVGDAASKKLYITADDLIIQLYINGVSTSFGDGLWTTVRTVDVPDKISSIAIEAIDIYYVIAGILLSTDDGSILSNSSWKCTTQYFDDWELATFNDSSWPAAYISANHTASDIFHAFMSPISEDAKWIWTKNFRSPNLDHRAYCRLSIDDDEYTCIGGDSPCTPANAALGKFYFKHTEKDRFVQCSEWGKCYVVQCSNGTLWSQPKLTCDWP